MTVWLVTFLVHSTLWCGAAWLLTRVRSLGGARQREIVWTAALVAGLVTPTVQASGGSGVALWNLGLVDPLLGRVDGGEHAPAVAAPWSRWAAGLWVAVSIYLVSASLTRFSVFHRRIGRREDVVDRRACAALDALCERANVSTTPRLTQHDELGTPVALGILRRGEICLPTRALHELDDDELDALLGHELAHHLRRDGIRLALVELVRAVLFVQPLLRLVARELHLASEQRCDEWAASHLDDRLAMASCLTRVAGWIMPNASRVPAPCMARRGSQLERRVRGLLDDDGPAGHRRAVGTTAAAVALVVVSPWLTPGVVADVGGEHARGSEHGQRLDRGREHDRPSGFRTREHRDHERGDHE